MPDHPIVPLRRRLIAAIPSLGALATLPTAVLAALIPTPRQALGPFYPDAIPLDSDNDLVQVEGRPGVAAGEIADLSGRLIGLDGRPVGGALVEIWQCDANGRYLHAQDDRSAPRESLIVAFEPAPGNPVAQLKAEFDIVLG